MIKNNVQSTDDFAIKQYNRSQYEDGSVFLKFPKVKDLLRINML